MRKYTRNQHSAMLIVGNRMWKLMLAANWMRESSSVSMVRSSLAGRGGRPVTRSFSSSTAGHGGAHAHELHGGLGRELLHVVEPGHEPVDQLVHLAHARLRMAVGLVGGLLEQRHAQHRKRGLDLAPAPLLGQHAEDLPDVLRRLEVFAPVARLVLQRTSRQACSSFRPMLTLERENSSVSAISSALSARCEMKIRA